MTPPEGPAVGVVAPMQKRLLALLLAATALTAASAPVYAQDTRVHHTTTLLPNGNILVTGGVNTAGAVLGTVEIFFSTRGAPTALGAPMNVARASHTATLLPDGRVLVTGGISNGGVILNNAEVYNPATNTWAAILPANPMSAARYNHTATLLPDGRVLVAGGQDNAGTVSATCDVFTPQTNSFVPTGSMRLARAGHTATLLYNNKVFIAGGYILPSIDYAVSTELLDPNTGVWSPGPTLVQKRAYHTATTLGNRNVLLAGGYNGRNLFASQGYLETTELYNPVSDSISPGPPMQERKSYHSATLRPDGSINVAGGLGNITTSYFMTSLRFDSGSSLTDTSVLLATGIIQNSSNLTLLMQPQLAISASGVVVDGEVSFSSPTATLEDAKVFFTNPGTKASLTGIPVTKGVLNPNAALLTLTQPGGQVLFFPRQANSYDVILQPGSSWLRYDNPPPADIDPAKTKAISSGILDGYIDVPFPLSDLGGTVLIGNAAIVSGTVLRSNDEDTGGGFTATLTGGTGSLIYPLSPAPQVVSDGRGGAHLVARVQFSGVTGSITNTSSNNTLPYDTPAGAPDRLDVSELNLISLNLYLNYVVSPIDLTGASFSFDVATVTIRRMLFSDVEMFDASKSAWSFRDAAAPPAYGKNAVLTPNGDEVYFGGTACAGAQFLTCGAGYQSLMTQSPQGLIPTPLNQPWTGAASLATGRSHHTTTILPDGRLLIAGGTDGDHVLNTCELADISDPSSTDVSETGAMRTPRNLHTATLLTDGSVLVAGGFTTTGSTAPTSAAEIYYPLTGAWVPTSPMSSSRSYHTAVMLPDGNVLAAGGYDAQGNMLATAEIYIATAAVWRPINSMSGIARGQHTMTLLQNGTVLVTGGVNTAVLSRAETYNPLTGVWTNRAAMSAGRYAHTATLLLDGRVLVTGGDDGNGEISDSEIYDPIMNTWTRTNAQGNSMLVARMRHNATLLPDGKVLVTGGVNALGEAIQWAEGFDVQFSSWQMQGMMVNARGYHTTTLTNEGFVFAVGGFDGLNRLDALESRYYAGEIDFYTPGGTQRQPQDVDVDTGTVTRSSVLTLRGSRFKGVTEASSGRGNAQSSYHHPRLYFQRMDGSGNNSQAASGFAVDLSTRIYISNSPNSWANVDSSITFTVPESTGLLPNGWYQVRVAANAQFSTAKTVQVGPPRPTGPTMAPGVPIGTRLGVSSIAWSWANVSTTPANPTLPDGYHVYSATNGVFLGTCPITSTTFIQRNLGPDTVGSISVAPFTLSGDGPVNTSTIPINTYSGLVSGLQAEAMSPASIVWSWSVNPAALTYHVYSTTQAAKIASVSNNSYTLTQLSTNTAYGLFVQAVTESGNGPLTSPVTAYTMAAQPSPGIPPIDSVSTGSLRGVWFPNTNTAGTQYAVQIVKESGSSVTVEGVKSTFYVIAGLDVQPNTYYGVNVAAVNGDSRKTAFTVLNGTYTYAKPPTGLSVSFADPSNVRIAWQNNGNPSSTTYQVMLSSDGFATDISTPVTFSSGYTALSASLAGLLTGKTYTIRVMARNHFGVETAFVSTTAFTENGGGPPGSLSVLAKKGETTVISGNIGSGRTIALRVNSTTFDQDVRLFIASETLAACGNIDSAISIIASPSAELRAPLEIEIHYLPADAGNITDPAKLAIVRYDPGSRTCVPLKSRIDGNLALGTLRVTAETNHLSVFKVMQIQPTGSISDMRVFPNPLFTHSQVYFTFDQLPAGARVRVYTLHGEEVFDGTANASGLLTWNARNKYGRSVASGIYLAVVEGGGEKKILKVVVVR
ncbi:MAG TPA: hypothetical protein DCM05_11750 [Elusimicrobia bacterium]|nr:hypothetical protein [Elusimicrobiota bacterium]